jgi:hypothetical protein
VGAAGDGLAGGVAGSAAQAGESKTAAINEHAITIIVDLIVGTILLGKE